MHVSKYDDSDRAGTLTLPEQPECHLDDEQEDTTARG